MKYAVSYDDQSLLINGEHVQIISGAVHYFRIPRGEWADRLAKCKHAGLNTIETIIPWNIHEYREGEYTFGDNRDLESFLNLCQEYGFYVIVRPSPYICGEWDNGGLPFWLVNKDHVEFRRSNLVYLSYIEKWYDCLMPIIRKHLYTYNGSITLVQIENEYGYFEDANELSYMLFLKEAMVSRGINVPLITCDLPGKGLLIPDTVKCANFGSDFGAGLKTLRAEQPGAFLFVSELWLAWFDHWGGQHHSRPARSVSNALKEVLSAGGHYNFYMWAGGTNFGYYGGRTTTGDYGAFITTSYDYDAPIGETGNITDKFYECRLVNWLANSWSDLFTPSSEGDCAWEPSDKRIVVTVRESDAGNTLFLKNPTDRDISFHLVDATASQRYPESHTWLLEGGSTMILVQDAKLTAVTTLVSCSTEVLCYLKSANTPTLILYGPPNTKCEVVGKVNGETTTSASAVVPRGSETKRWFLGDVEIVLVNRETAYVTWIDTQGDQPQWEIDPFFGTRNAPIQLPSLIWEEADVLAQLEKQDFYTSPTLFPFDTFHVHQGYGWYRTTFMAEGEGLELVLTNVRDRAHVFVNGAPQGIIGAFAEFARLPIQTRPGQNDLLILVDNLGRYAFTSRLGEHKGLWGSAYLSGRPVTLGRWKEHPASPFHFEVELPWTSGEGLLLRLAKFNKPLTLSVNGNLLHVHRSIADDDEFVELDVTRHLRPGHNTLELNAKEPLTPLPTIKAVAYSLLHKLSGPWRFYGGIIGEDADVKTSLEPFNALSWSNVNVHHPRGMHATTRPRMFRTDFYLSLTMNSVPVKLVVAGLNKGSVWLNDYNVGRYWNRGPQTALYLPTEWFCDGVNRLVIFDEAGHQPNDVHLIQEERFL